MNDREYYERLTAAYLRGRAERMRQEEPEIRAEGEKQEEKLYYFKRSPEKLPRVRMALGFLRSVWPESLLDVGSGRGAFLFPFLEEFPGEPVYHVRRMDVREAFCVLRRPAPLFSGI